MTMKGGTLRAAAVLLALSLSAGCADSPPEQSASPVASHSPKGALSPRASQEASNEASGGASPSWSAPGLGEWTREDLLPGRVVPREELDRLFPVWDKPEPPATLTQPTEQGARDAAVYFTDVFEYVHASRDIAALNAIDQEFCLSCADIREQLARPRRRWGDHSPGQARAVHDTPELDNVFQVEVVGDPVEFVLLGAEADTIAVHRHSAADSMFIVVSYEEGRWVPVALERDEW